MSIWHSADELPPEDSYVVVKLTSGKCEVGFEFEYDFDHIENWAFFDDLLALETELDRTRKALDVALCSLQDIAESDGDFITGASTPLDEHEYADMMLKEIKRQMKIKTALEQKE